MKPLIKILNEALLNRSNIRYLSRHKVSFKKKDLVFGSIVMLRNDLYGVYIPKEKCYILRKYFTNMIDGDVFLTDTKNFIGICISYTYLQDYDEVLKSSESKDYDVVRVYEDLITEDELNDDFIFSYYDAIRKRISGKKYIERK